MENSFSTPIKDQQQTLKANNSHNQTREGDWICLNCNNLNFSFRKKCNRCKTQTRKQNQEIQSAFSYYYYNQPPINSYLYQSPNSYALVGDQMYQSLDGNEQIQPIVQTNQEIENQILEKEQSLFLNAQNHQFIQVTLTSPFKEIQNIGNQKIQGYINKKLLTPSSKKKKCLKKTNDMLPSVSPLLKKLLAKEDTNSKSKNSISKDPLSVALFYDQIWDNNKQNVQVSSLKQEEIQLQRSGRKCMKKSRFNRTNDSMNGSDDEQFPFLVKSPQKQLTEEDTMEIDEKENQFAQLIKKIMI